MAIGGLRNWLAKATPQAERLRSEFETLEMDVRRKIDEIKAETGLMDIDFSLSWTLTHCRGCLVLFRKALSTSRVPVVNLKGWVSRFISNKIVYGLGDQFF